jgi:PAS domain S-box-containing protein
VPQPETDLEEFFDLSIDPQSIIGFDGAFKHVNASFLRLLGYTKPELFSRSVLEILHPDDVEPAREALAQLTHGHDLFRFDARVICADGAVRWLEWNTRSAPERGVVYSVGRDITERLRIDAEMREGQRLLEASRDELRVLAEEQAALRRVATLVAEDVPSKELFGAVAREVATLLGSDFAGMIRYEDDDSVTTVAAWAAAGEHPLVPSRWDREPGDSATIIEATREPARVDDWTSVPGSLATFIRNELGVSSSVACPIVVEGRLWGALAVHSKQSQPLPPDTESRIAQFTDLVGTAIANAESRTEVERLAAEQAALRRVAILVAQQPSPSEVFTAVTEAVGQLLGADLAVLHVFPGDGAAMTIASWSREGPILPIGTRFPLDGANLAARIFKSGAPARVHPDDEVWQREATDVARSLRVRSAVGAPILVEGKLWGALMAATRRVEPWADDAETRIAAFTELAATAIANAESLEARAVLTEEQAALRRVATLVAQAASPQELVESVAEEVGRLLPVGSATLGRFEPDGSVTTVASWSATVAAFPSGRRWPTKGTNVAWMVLETGRSARLDDFSAATDPIGVAAREAGIKSAVGSPVIVEGHLWGVMTATSTEGPLPADTEARLASFTELVATAIANAESSEELAASRRRLVAASDAARRRVVRDLHDGAQQRLVHTIVTLKLARRASRDEDGKAESLLSEALEQAEQSNRELRELAHGILPAVLTRGGLRAGVDAVVARLDLPVEVAVTPERFPAEIEASAYFIVAEALTNVVKHSHAGRAEVTASLEDGMVHIEVRDNGAGGADRDGHGLVGMRDRVTALGGRLEIESPAGGGTRVAATLPLS